MIIIMIYLKKSFFYTIINFMLYKYRENNPNVWTTFKIITEIKGNAFYFTINLNKMILMFKTSKVYGSKVFRCILFNNIILLKIK